MTLYVSKDEEPEVNSKDYSNIPSWYSYSLTDSLLGESTHTSKLLLDKYSLSLDINESFTLTAFMSDSSPMNRHVSYVTSDSSVATVDYIGNITAKKQGVATITATDLLSLRRATCIVTVSADYAPTEPTEPSVKPTEPTEPSVKPTEPTEPSEPTVKPTGSITLSDSELRLYVGTQYILTATSDSTVNWSTSDSAIATVSDGLVTVKSAGEVVITAKTSTKSAKCTITALEQKLSIHASTSSATVTAGKTYFAKSNTSGVTWTSHNTDIVTVDNGFIYGVKPGKAIVEIYKKGGKQTILVTVKEADPIRFAYSSPNCAPKNSEVTLIAITDSARTDVKFDITVGSVTEVVKASSKTKDGKNYVWKAKHTFDSDGTFNVKAYAKKGTSWSTCDDGKTSVFVTSTTDDTTTICAKRRASDGLIKMIATFEGYLPTVYDDPLTGDPTLGYGKLVFVGEQFYNNLSKEEAYAYLSQAVNNDGYTSKVNSFLIDNKVRFNQQQFDALVCFVYNVGTGVLSNDDELESALLNCDSGSGSTKTYYINGSYVRIRKGPGTSYDIIDELDYGTELTILEKYSTSWYYVQLKDGTKGYVATDYISSKTASGDLDLDFVKKQNLINKFCQYHHANGCIRGLLNRRLDEMEIFFFKDYDVDYGANNYGIKFSCANNPSFTA